MSVVTPVDLLAPLTAPGGEFEIAEQDVLGVRTPVFVHRHRSLGQLLAGSAGWGDRDYLVTPTRRIGYAAHASAVASLARGLQQHHGVTRGDRVAILAANSPEWIVAFWATVSLGAIAVGYNAWWTPAEIDYALEHATPTVLIADAKRRSRLGVRPVLPVLDIERDVPAMMSEYDDAALRDEVLDEDDPATIVYTSGTSGRPRGAVHSHRNIVAAAQYYRYANAVTAALRPEIPRDSGRYLLSMPLFHVASLHNLAVARLGTGETAVLTEGAFDPHRVLDLVSRERVTNWTVVPTMAARLVESGSIEQYDLSALRSFSVASAPASGPLQRRIRAALPASCAGPAISYGLSESCTAATIAVPDLLAHDPTTVGPPLPTVAIEIRSADGVAMVDGCEGEIWLRSPFNMLGYWADPDTTATTFDAQRWMRTGDIGTLRDGRLYLTSRRSDLILRGGENVYPAEIEQVLVEHPAVADCAVIGIDDTDLGQVPAAIVVLAVGQTVTDAQLVAFLSDRLAYYKVPARWTIGVPPLPRNASGKIVRHLLHLTSGTE